MAKHTHVSKYYADDKDILDLMSAGKMTRSKLHEFARSRGIFVSPDESESGLVSYLHTLACNREQLADLLKVIDSPDRVEKLTSRTLETNADAERLEEACTAVISERAGRGEDYIITKFTAEHVQVQVRYSETDRQRTRLLQRREKDLTLDLERKDGRLIIRHQDNSRAAEVVNGLVRHLGSESDGEPPQHMISLNGIRIPKLRNTFFVSLMEGIDGYDLDDVVDVKVDKLSKADDTITDDNPQTGDEAAEVESAAEKEQLEYELKKVRLSGRGLLYSSEYQRLTKTEFFISRAVWVSKQSGAEGSEKVEFIAEFSEPDSGEGFRYNATGSWKKNDEGGFKEAKSQITSVDRNRLLKLLEASAQEALESVSTEVTENAEEPLNAGE